MELLFIGVYVFFLLFILLYSLMELNLLFLYLFKSDESSKPNTTDLPFVTIQLPVYNEVYVVERIIDASANLDYPQDRFEIQVLDDSTDETSSLIRNRVEFWEKRGVRIKHVIRPDRRGFKAGAYHMA